LQNLNNAGIGILQATFRAEYSTMPVAHSVPFFSLGDTGTIAEPPLYFRPARGTLHIAPD